MIAGGGLPSIQPKTEIWIKILIGLTILNIQVLNFKNTTNKIILNYRGNL